MSTQNVIDLHTFENLKASVGVDFTAELVDTYCEDTPRLMVEMQQALLTQDSESFHRTAHSIKSTSASMGALQFSALAKELEMIAKTGKLDGVAPAVDQLIAMYAHVESALRGLSRD